MRAMVVLVPTWDPSFNPPLKPKLIPWPSWDKLSIFVK